NTEYSSAGQYWSSFTIYIPPFWWTITTFHKWDYTNEFSMGWLNLPLLAKFTPIKTNKFRFGLLAGPYAAYRMSYKVVQIDHLKGDARTTIDKWGGDDFKKLDAGATFGINLEILMKKVNLILDLRYNLGVLKVDKSSNMKTNSIVAMIGIGFK
ncbi:MAG: PorT family protein, partial [Candidatus Aminicenantes bacterium]|nr:PorT family protein [Candidatus Aminicenantes bacterium]